MRATASSATLASASLPITGRERPVLSAIEAEEGHLPGRTWSLTPSALFPTTSSARDHLELFANGAYHVDTPVSAPAIRTSTPSATALPCGPTPFAAETYIALATNAVRSGIVAGHNIGGTVLDSYRRSGFNHISEFWWQHGSPPACPLPAATRAGRGCVPMHRFRGPAATWLYARYRLTSRSALSTSAAAVAWWAPRWPRRRISPWVSTCSRWLSEEGVTIDKLKSCSRSSFSPPALQPAVQLHHHVRRWAQSSSKLGGSLLRGRSFFRCIFVKAAVDAPAALCFGPLDKPGKVRASGLQRTA